MSWAEWVEEECGQIAEAGRWREVREFDARSPSGTLGDREVVSFASNDYLGLTQHPEVLKAAHSALERWGSGSTASRLTAGSRPVHSKLEAELADWKQAQSALLFATGFAANLGVLSTFGRPGVRICSDALNHASIIDGCRLSRADACVYRHCDVADLEKALRGARRAVVVTETVFSMDGDRAPVEAIADACRRYDALLVLDEAHGVLDRTPDLEGVTTLRVGTLSKTMASLGGFVAGPARFMDLVINRARSFIFTTAPSPADAAAALAALRISRSPEGARLRSRLTDLVQRVAPGHPSPIIPIVLGSEKRALEAAAQLLKRGLLVPAIRPPTVPPATSRLRITLSAAHRDSDIDALQEALACLAV